ncbi:LLM class flavin-dependent oxidoreductase [Microbacterium sp. GXF0217]
MTLRTAFFTRLLDDASPADRFRLALEQIQHSERFGVGRAWVAQHHFRAAEGGLPSPFVFIAHAAAHTSEIRLGTGVVTLTLEDPVRVAEDAVVADLLAGGRVDLGLGSGGTPTSFAPFGLALENKTADYERKLATLVDALAGGELPAGNRLHPPAGSLADRVWQATFSAAGGVRAGVHGHGLLLSRTQPRPADRPDASLAEIQQPIVDAYLAALPAGAVPRITASRNVFISERPVESTASDHPERADAHVGTPEQVIASLSADATLRHADEIAFQVPDVHTPHALILRSIELFATEVAPALGWDATAPAIERTS